MLLIKNGRIIDPATHLDVQADLLIRDDRVEEIGKIAADKDTDVIDATGMIVAPGLVDNHVHFRDPGLTYKEDIESGSKAAAAGGFTTVVCMANTKPPVDSVDVLQDILSRAEKLPIHLKQSATVTKNMAGEELTDMPALKEAGAIGFTDDGVPITDETLLLNAMRNTKALNMAISLHEEDPAFVGSAGVNEGKIARTIGVAGASHLAEEILVARDCLLAKETGCRIDIQHLSSGVSVDVIRFMKSIGVDVWCEVTPQHLYLTEQAVLKKGAFAKINPPFRTEEDRVKLIEGLKEGVIDMIVTDHAPHAQYEKDKGIRNGAPSGIVGLETSLALSLSALVKPGYMTIPQLIEKMTISPARFYHMDAGRIEIGKAADLCLFDPSEEWTVTADDFYGKSKNSPFIGEKLYGRVKYTICDGKVIYKDQH